ncbi:IS4 family transposase, partial [Acinetobacter baumannii ABNIH13]
LVVSPQFNANAIQDYALRWEIETLFSCLKGRGFNLENTRLTDPRRVKKLIAVLAISFCWCYLTGEWQHDQKKDDKNKEAWTTLNEFISLWFRLCSNGDSAFNWFWEKRRV